MEQNGTKRNRIKSLPLLRTPEGRSTPGMALPSACSSGSLRRPREGGRNPLSLLEQPARSRSEIVTETMTTEPQPIAPPRLVIFDCDGVLVDSEALIDRVFGRLLADYGLQLQPDDDPDAFPRTFE